MADRATLQKRLDMYRACEVAILSGAQRYEVEDKVFERADLRVVRSVIKELEDLLGATSPTIKKMRTQNVLFRRH